MFGFELIDVFWPVGKVLKSSRKDNPNTYLPGAQNTTWEIYSEEFLRGIPAEQAISETVKGSDSSFAAHTHGLPHKHDIRSGLKTTSNTWATKGGSISLAHTHTVAQHAHEASTSHKHSANDEETLSFFGMTSRTIYTAMGKTTAGSWYTAAAGPISVTEETTETGISSGNSETTVAESSETGLLIGIGFDTALGFVSTNSAPLESAGMPGQTNNIPGYKEIYQWIRLT